jgi:hypothetical protein
VRSGFYAVQLISHKVLRYLVPVFLIAVFITTAMLATRNIFYAAMFGAQLCFYLAAASGWALERLGARIALLALPHYFVLANFASLLAFYKFLRGERYARWEPIREPGVNHPGTMTTAATAQSAASVTTRIRDC